MAEEVLTRFRQRFTKTSNDIELIEMLRDILPFDDYKVASVKGNKKNFKAVIECKQEDSEDAIRAFMIQYNQKTSETLWKLTPNFPSEKNCFYKYVYFRCHHKTNHEATMNPSKVLNPIQDGGGGRIPPPKRFFLNNFFHTKVEGL